MFYRLACCVLAASLLVRVSTGRADTVVGGPITNNTTWTLAGSPYIVNAAITIRNNATLTINPGVEVRLAAGMGIVVGHVSLGAGTLKAIGSASQRIKFTSTANPGTPGFWKDILFTDFSTDATYDGSGNYIGGCTLQHCIVEYAGSGSTESGTVTVSQASPLVSHTEIRHSARSGLWASNNTADVPVLTITNCEIHHNQSGGNPSGGGGARLATYRLCFIGNTLTDNSANGGGSSDLGGGGLYATVYGSSIVSDNVISGNSIFWGGGCCGLPGGGGMHLNLAPSLGEHTIAGNTIANNQVNGSLSYGFGGGVFIQANGAGTPHVVRFADNILDGNSAPSGGALAIRTSGQSTVQVVNNQLVQNLAHIEGGALFLTRNYSSGEARFVITDNAFDSNETIATNGSSALGGGVCIRDASGTCCTGSLRCTFSGNVFAGNMAVATPPGTSRGGGLYVDEQNPFATTIVDLSGQRAVGESNVFSGNDAAFGEAIYNSLQFNKNGSNDINAQYICWGGDDPSNVFNNLIYDFYDNPQLGEVYFDNYITDPNCADPSGCGVDLILDCNGNCCPADWIGDGVCDNGAYSYNGVPIFLNCPQPPFNNDGGDCAASPPQPPGVHTPPTQPPPPAPPPPTPQERNLLFITHGAFTTTGEFNDKWQPLQSQLQAQMGNTWQVQVYPWTPTVGQGLPYILTGYPPGPALTRAIAEGESLGQAIDWDDYDHIHLVAHSAGSALITMMAAYAHGIPDGPTVHLTYLDAYAGVLANSSLFGGDTVALRSVYGLNSDWSDQYFSLESSFDTSVVCGNIQTGSPTEMILPEAFNVDVSLLDPDFDPDGCLSSHNWPRCFYRHSIGDGSSFPCLTGPTAAYGDFGFRLGKEVLLGNWLATVSQPQYAPGNSVVLPGGGIAGSGSSNQTYRIRTDAPVNPQAIPLTSSGPPSIVVSPSGFTATTSGQSPGGAAWITMQVQTAQKVNFIRYSADFTSAAGSQGILTAYVDGEEAGSIDERYAAVGVNDRVAMLAADIMPGQHTIAFRLDRFTAVESSAIVTNIATGRGAFVAPGDVNVDEQVDVDDLIAVILSWGPCPAAPAACPADVAPVPDGNGQVDVDDLITVILNWG